MKYSTEFARTTQESPIQPLHVPEYVCEIPAALRKQRRMDFANNGKIQFGSMLETGIENHFTRQQGITVNSQYVGTKEVPQLLIDEKTEWQHVQGTEVQEADDAWMRMAGQNAIGALIVLSILIIVALFI